MTGKKKKLRPSPRGSSWLRGATIVLFTWVVCAKEWKFFGLSASYGVGDLAGLIWKVVFYLFLFLFLFY